MRKYQKFQLDLKKIFIPIFLLTIGVVFSYYVVEFPQDRIVKNFINYRKILKLLWQHIYIVTISSSAAILTSVPLGILLTRNRFKKFAKSIVAVVNIGQTVPSLAMVALFVGILGVGVKTAVIALWIYSLLPILNNTMVGLLEVNEEIIEAAKGMGMRPRRVLRKIEIPLALPVIIAGIRTAVIINIGTAILGGFVGAGGLGEMIIAGNNINRWQILVLGASLPALMALLADYLLNLLEEGLITS